MNKLTLLIDGNWLLISRFSIVKNTFDNNQTEEQLNASQQNLKDMMARSINIMINRFPEIDNIIFISDGGSWRKQLPVPAQLSDTTYKGNRAAEKTNEVSWKHVFGALNDIGDACKTVGITTCQQNNIEGDDWVWYWSRRLNEQGTNCIIWSSDNDLRQLIQWNGHAFTTWYYERSGNKELSFPNTLEDKKWTPGDMDFFMTNDIIKPQLMESIIKKVNVKSFVDPNSIILNKVICGDSGDNIKSVVKVIKNNRKYGVGQKDWEKIATKLNINTIQDLIHNKYNIANEISNLKKFDGKVDKEQILEMIDYNIKLVWLNEQVIPSSIIDIMNQHDYDVYDINYLRGNYRILLNDDEDNYVKNLFECV